MDESGSEGPIALRFVIRLSLNQHGWEARLATLTHNRDPMAQAQVPKASFRQWAMAEGRPRSIAP